MRAHRDRSCPYLSEMDIPFGRYTLVATTRHNLAEDQRGSLREAAIAFGRPMRDQGASAVGSQRLPISMPNARAELITMVVSATYAATTWHDFNAGKEPAASALAKAPSVPETGLPGAVTAGTANRFSDRCERPAARNWSRLAAFGERLRSIVAWAVCVATVFAFLVPIAVPASAASPTYAETVLSEHPLVYYRVSEQGGPSATDDSGNGVTGTYASAGVTYQATGPLASGMDSAITYTADSVAPAVRANDGNLPSGSSV
jgi:hypothetical protein